MMRNNVWLAIENNLAVAWNQWMNWYMSDPVTRGPEPPLDEWDKKAMRRLADLDYSYRAFKKATIPALAPKDKWRMLSVYDIKLPEWIDAGLARHGEADEGGDLGVGGVWYWEPGDSQCAYDEAYPWKANQVILFMPDVCTARDAEGTCTATELATQIIDVNLLYGQPPREFPAQSTRR